MKRPSRAAASAAAEAAKYEKHKAAAADRQRRITSIGQEVGPLPDVVDPERRARCAASFKQFCKTYFPKQFYLEWSRDQLVAIDRVEECALHGGLFALAMPRGGGKTAIIRIAAIWALLNGYRKFAILICATGPLAGRLLRDIKKSLQTNELLLEDYPEVCWPIKCLRGEARRCTGQKLNGEPTAIKWAEDEIVLPTVAGSASSGGICRTRGITGAIRGANFEAPDGSTWRPDLILLDDVQTRDSAKSLEQTADRELTIDGDVLDLAGPDKTIACLMACTCIYPNDLSARYLSRELHPDWRGEIFRALYVMPERLDLWKEYEALRVESFRDGGRGEEATAFYVAHRAEMDRGAEVGWEGRKKKNEVSALQSCMNARIDRPRAFQAEWQNDPEEREDLGGDCRQLTAQDLAAKLDTRPIGTAPRNTQALTCFVDIQAEVLFWMVCGWTPRFGGGIVAYGAFPDQRRDVFSTSEPSPRLSDLFPRLERDARIYAALGKLVPWLFGKSFGVVDAAGMSIGRCLIDCGYATDAIHDFIARSPLKTLLRASKGKGIGSDAKPMDGWARQPGDMVGPSWRYAARTYAKGRFVHFDTYVWKSFVAEGLLAEPGSPAAIYLPGQSLQRSREEPHKELLVSHLLSEYRKRTGSVEVWKMRPGQAENHWWDALVGNAVTASTLGIAWSAPATLGEEPRPQMPRKKRNIEEIYERSRQAQRTKDVEALYAKAAGFDVGAP